MQFVMGDILGFGMVGLVYYTTGGYLLSRLIFFATLIFAVIGLVTMIKWIFGGRGFGRRHKETDGEYWMRTGKMRK